MFLVPWIFALALLWHPGCEAEALSAAQGNYSIAGFDVALLKDDGGGLTVEDLERPALAARFVRLSGSPQLGYAKEVVWLRLRLQRLADAPQTWYLEYSNPFVNDLRLYSRSATGFTVAQAGDQFPFAERALKYSRPLFTLAFPNATMQTFYLRMDSDSTLAGQLQVWQPGVFWEQAQHRLVFSGAVLGMLCMSFLLSVIHWLHSRERKVLLFSVLTVNAFFLVAAGLGLVAQVLTPTLPAIADLLVPWSLALTTVSIGVVIGNALGIAADFPRMQQFLMLAYGLTLAAPFTRWFNLYGVWGGPLLQLVTLAVVCCTGWVSWLRWRSHAHGAAYYFAAHLVVIGSLVTGRLMFMGWLPSNFFAYVSAIPSMLAFVLLVHAGIFVDAQAMKEERDAAFAKIKTAEEVLLSERSLREEQTVFFSFVAHELRSPLAAIGTGLNNLEDELGGVQQRLLARTRRIKAYAQRMGSLIDRHLTLQHLADADFSPRLAPRDPRHIAEESLRHVRGLYVQREFTLDCDAALPACASLDEDLMRMALENLLINAAKFSPAGTAVALDVLADTALHFRVSDRGPGIQAGHMERLFSIFKQMQQSDFSSGFGIGLAIAQRVAQAHGGSLNYAARAGGGAVFTLSLPLLR